MKLGQLTAWTLSEMERKALVRDKSQARKRAEKMWEKWEKQGLLTSNPEAALPSPQSMFIITAATAAYREATVDWEKTGKQMLGPAYSRMKRARDRSVVTTAMSVLMTEAGKQQQTLRKEESSRGPKEQAAPTAPLMPVEGTAPTGGPTSIYPVLPKAPPPYQSTPPPEGARGSIQAPVVTVKGGRLDLDLPSQGDLRAEVADMTSTMADIVERSLQQVDRLAKKVTDISQNQTRRAGTRPLTTQSPTPVTSTPMCQTEPQLAWEGQPRPRQSPASTSTLGEKQPPLLAEELEAACRAPISSDDEVWGEERGEPRAEWRLERDPDGWSEMPAATPLTGTIIGRFEGHLEQQDLTPRPSRQGHSMRLRSSAASIQPGEPVISQCPLRLTGNGTPANVPFAHRDMEGLIGKLPPLSGGAEEWISTLEGMTMGETLCAGDMRALLGRIEGKEVAKRLLKMSGVGTGIRDSQPLNTFRNLLWAVLRREFPTDRNADSVGDIKMRPEEGMLEYLKRAGQLWARHTGARHDSSEAIQSLWRMQCVKGLPEPVQKALTEVVGLPKMTYKMWVENLDHHHRKHQSKRDEEEEELKALSKRLLRHQVKAKDDDANKTKTKVKQMAVMSEIKTEVEEAVAAALKSQLLGEACPYTHMG